MVVARMPAASFAIATARADFSGSPPLTAMPYDR
jgi:hypothetical protein